MQNSDFEIKNGILWKYHGAEEHVILPDGVTKIGQYAFYRKKLTSVSIPDSVTTIETEAFYECFSLEQIFIPDSVTAIGENAFCGCRDLAEIHVSGGNPQYLSYDGILYDKVSSELIRCPQSRKIAIIRSGTKSIGYRAFYGCFSLESLVIPEGVTTIGEECFFRCANLTSIVIPQSVTNVDKMAFYACRCLSEIQLPEHITMIERNTFSYCSNLKYVHIPEGVTTIGAGAFFCCRSLEEISIPQGMTNIQNSAFTWCRRLKKVILPDNISLGAKVFDGCVSLKSIVYRNTAFPVDSYEELIYLLNFLGIKQNAPKMNADKCHALLNLYFCCPENPEIIAYISSCFRSMIPFLCSAKNKDFLKKIIERKIFIRKSNIDQLIQCTIDNSCSELTLLLIDYKAQYIGYDSDEDIIRKKFSL